MLVHEFLTRTVGRSPERAALVVEGECWSFRAIDHASDRLACELRHSGVGRGDRVAAMLDNSAEMVIALWGTLKAGAVFVPLNHGTKDDKLGFILADCEVSCLIAPSQLHQRIAAALALAPSVHSLIWVGDAVSGEAVTGDGVIGSGRRLEDILAQPHRRPDPCGVIDQDLCLLIYTSGSTGRPKGVMMTHHNIRNNVRAISTYLGNVPEDVVLSVLPLSFDYGLFQVLTGARIGFTVVLEKSFAFPYQVLKLVGEHRVTGLPGVPTMFATMLRFAPFADLDLSSLRYLSNTAAPLPPSHIRRLRELLPKATIFSMYGLTECTRVSYLDPAKLDEKPGSVGKAMPNSETYIVDDGGRRLGPGELGELVVRGSSVMRGYWRRPEETAKALRDGDVAGEKVLYTGDLFLTDADGDLYFVGRKDDVFKCRGEKVSPKEVEAVLYEMDAVAEAAVIGVPDPVDGMAIKAFIVPRSDYRLIEQEVRRHCHGRLEPRLVPRHIEICSSLPKTDSGKITKTALRAAGGAAEPLRHGQEH